MEFEIEKVNAKKLFYDENYRNSFNEKEDNIWQSIYNGISSGLYDYAFYDYGNCDHDFQKFFICRSAKNKGYLQVTCIHMENPETISYFAYDEQYGNLHDFKCGMHHNGIKIRMEKQEEI